MTIQHADSIVINGNRLDTYTVVSSAMREDIVYDLIKKFTIAAPTALAAYTCFLLTRNTAQAIYMFKRVGGDAFPPNVSEDIIHFIASSRTFRG